MQAITSLRFEVYMTLPQAAFGTKANFAARAKKIWHARQPARCHLLAEFESQSGSRSLANEHFSCCLLDKFIRRDLIE
jgi:hypothetical protein